MENKLNMIIADESMNSQASTQKLRETQEFEISQELISNDSVIWGKLLSMKKTCQVYNLSNSQYSFGRGDVDHRFTTDLFDKTLLPVLSKVHFVITRIHTSNDDYVIEIEDRSSNGTFINGLLIGQKKKKFLRNNDVISLATCKAKVFSFHDCMKNDSKEFPDELNQKYIVLKKIGEGAYGEVRLAYAEVDHTPAAVKILKKKSYTEGGQNLLKDNNIAAIKNEVRLLESVDHPFIIKLLDIIETQKYIYIVTEYAEGGELFDKILSTGGLSEATAKRYFYQLLHAIAYLHQKKIVHRDIKPENILLATDEENTIIKLTDFGLSKLDYSVMTTFCGTSIYIAPEILDQENRNYTNKADMWSLGVVLYVCLLATVPFSGETDRDKLANTWKGKYITNTPGWKKLSSGARNLIQKLLVVDPKKRLSVQETLEHEWLQDREMVDQVTELINNEVKSCSKQQLKRPRDCDQDRDSTLGKTPKLMSGIEFG